MLWVTADVLFTTINGLRIGLDPGSLGPGFYISTGFNRPLLVTNGLILTATGASSAGPRAAQNRDAPESQGEECCYNATSAE